MKCGLGALCLVAKCTANELYYNKYIKYSNHKLIQLHNIKL